MKVEVVEGKLKAFELVSALNYDCSVDVLIKRAEVVYKYIFGTEKEERNEDKSIPRAHVEPIEEWPRK